jgi:hypothetical protein
MSLKARGLAQHGGLRGWLEESDPAGVILHVVDGPYRLPFPYRTGCPDRSCPAARDEFPSAVTVYSKCTQPSVMSYVTKKGMAWYYSIPMPSLWARLRIALFQPAYCTIKLREDDQHRIYSAQIDERKCTTVLHDTEKNLWPDYSSVFLL